MHVVLASSEAAPFAQTGGLGEFCGSLAAELAGLGHEVSLFLPAYGQVFAGGHAWAPADIELNIPIGAKTVSGRLLRSQFPGTDSPVYLVQQDDYFLRPGLYVDKSGREFRDNCERYVFFCRAVMESLPALGIEADVLHANDWQTGLLPAYLATEYRNVPALTRMASLFTFQNVALQGNFWHWDMLLTGIDWKYFNWQQMEFFGNLSLLKTGLVFAGAISTVSPHYARQLQFPPQGCGLEGVFRQRAGAVHGILNGIDVQRWNPADDPQLPQNYSVDRLEGKARCKAALQAEWGLPVRPQSPLVAVAEVNGGSAALTATAIQQWSQSFDVQWAVLAGDPASPVHEELRQTVANLAGRSPCRAALRAGDEGQLRRLLAAADMVLLAPRSELSGTLAMQALRYGTVPVAYETGGLADVVRDLDAAPSEESADDESNRPTGFRFHDHHIRALTEALHRACKCYHEQPETWRQLMRNGLTRDWSWRRVAQEYERLYRELIARPGDGLAGVGAGAAPRAP